MRTQVKRRQNKIRQDKGDKPKQDNTTTGVHKRGRTIQQLGKGKKQFWGSIKTRN
jgi:hypothetical protein